MSDITKTPYASFLEDVIRLIMEQQPAKIVICTMNPDFSMLTGYYGNCDHQDKPLIPITPCSGTMSFEGKFEDVLKALSVMIGSGNGKIHIAWDVA